MSGRAFKSEVIEAFTPMLWFKKTAPASDAFKRFELSCFGPQSYDCHDVDDVDTGALLRLQGSERERAEELMLKHLSLEDHRPADGLGALRSSKSAPLLKQLLPQAQDRVLIAIAVALWRIEQYPPALDCLLAALREKGDSRNSEIVAGILCQFPCETVVVALVQALQDSRELVRYSAMESLATLYRIGSRDSLRRDIRSSQPEERKRAIAELMRRIASKGKEFAWEHPSDSLNSKE